MSKNRTLSDAMFDFYVEKRGNPVPPTAFSELSVSQNYPFIQGSAVYGLIPANFRTFTAVSGSAAASGRLFKVNTGTSQFGYGAIQSFRSLNAKSGQSIMSRFSGYFTEGVANYIQGIGLIAIGDEVSFGYNGEDFGVWHRYGGIAECRTITVTGASGGSTDLTLTLNGVAYTIPLTSGSVQHNAYEIAAWLNSNQSVWAADQLDDTVIINALSDGAKSGSYSFSHATATGTIAQTRAGVTKTSDFVAQSDWARLKTSTSFDPTKGNVYQIVLQDMGFGEILFYVENPDTGEFVNVHTISPASQTTTTVLGNPSLRAGMYAASLGGSGADIEVFADSFGVFNQGGTQKTRNPRSYSNTVTLAGTTETIVLALRNRKTYNGYTNQVEIEPLRASIASEVNKNVIFRVRAIQNPSVELNFQTAGNNLVGDVADGPVTSFSSGRFVDGITVPPNDGKSINLREIELKAPAGLTLVLTAQRTGGASGDVTSTITWYEDL